MFVIEACFMQEIRKQMIILEWQYFRSLNILIPMKQQFYFILGKSMFDSSMFVNSIFINMHCCSLRFDTGSVIEIA